MRKRRYDAVVDRAPVTGLQIAVERTWVRRMAQLILAKSRDAIGAVRGREPMS